MFFVSFKAGTSPERCCQGQGTPERKRRGRGGGEAVDFTSVQDGVSYALGKAHMRSTPSLRGFSPSVAFETLSDRRWPSLVLSRKIVESFVFLASSRRSMV